MQLLQRHFGKYPDNLDELAIVLAFIVFSGGEQELFVFVFPDTSEILSVEQTEHLSRHTELRTVHPGQLQSSGG